MLAEILGLSRPAVPCALWKVPADVRRLLRHQVAEHHRDGRSVPICRHQISKETMGALVSDSDLGCHAEHRSISLDADRESPGHPLLDRLLVYAVAAVEAILEQREGKDTLEIASRSGHGC